MTESTVRGEASGSPAWSSALDEGRAVLGADHVLASRDVLQRYEANVTGFSRRVMGVLRPSTTAEVVEVVRIANRHRTPLHAFGRGKNWGMGSRLPPRGDAFVVDLGRMNRIREVNGLHAYTVVEPGVTQAQVHEHLLRERLPLILNVIGSSSDSSLLGNALDRGIGYFATRAEQISGLEVVLGNGTVLQTGFGHYATSRITHVYKHGIGPSLDGLFLQSNYGIVTAAGVSLQRWHDEHVSVIARLDDPTRLPALIDALADLRRRNIVQMVVHVGNRARTFHTLAPLVCEQLIKDGVPPETARAQADALLEAEGFGPWSAVASLSGTASQLRVARRLVNAALRPLGSLIYMTAERAQQAKVLLRGLRFLPGARRKSAILAAMDPIFGLSLGVPTDEAVKSVYWSADVPPPTSRGELANPDESAAGLLYCVPMMPLEGTCAARVVQLTEEHFARSGFTPLITLNLLDDRCAEAVISLPFRRDQPDRVARAHDCVAALQDAFIGEGFIPYRTPIDFMNQFVREGDPFWGVVRDLKKVLDPNGIISPGRYNLT